MKPRISPIIGLLVTMAGIAALTFISPAEQSLGSHVRIVYLHGAWVWAALVTLWLMGIILQRTSLHIWSRAFGRIGMILWVTYLPISLWAMQANWNGLFLDEPRWQIAVVFAVSGILMQVGLSLLEKPIWASICNLFFVSTLVPVLTYTQEVMHPSSPIFRSESQNIQGFFMALLGLTLFAAWQASRWWYSHDAQSFSGSHPSNSLPPIQAQ